MVSQKGDSERLGPGGYCVCPKCGHKVTHIRGNPCQNFYCQTCGVKMMRENSPHHELVKQKKA